MINICLNENKEESNITKISNDLKQYILHDRSDNEENLNRIPKGQKLEYEEFVRAAIDKSIFLTDKNMKFAFNYLLMKKEIK